MVCMQARRTHHKTLHHRRVVVLSVPVQDLPPHPIQEASGRADPARLTHTPLRASLAHSGMAQKIFNAAAMAAPSTDGTGTAAPAVFLPLEPSAFSPQRCPFSQESGESLIFTRGRHRRGNCEYLPTQRVQHTNSSVLLPSRFRWLSHRNGVPPRCHRTQP